MSSKIIQKITLWIAGIFLLFSFVWLASAQQDLLADFFKPAQDNDTILNFWDSKTSVWNALLQQSTTVGSDWGWIDVSSSDSLLIIWTKFLLRITVALSVTMIIYNGIKYMIEVWQWKERLGTETQKHLTYVVVGLIVALSSVIIITLLSSTVSTISNAIT